MSQKLMLNFQYPFNNFHWFGKRYSIDSLMTNPLKIEHWTFFIENYIYAQFGQPTDILLKQFTLILQSKILDFPQ